MHLYDFFVSDFQIGNIYNNITYIYSHYTLCSLIIITKSFIYITLKEFLRVLFEDLLILDSTCSACTYFSILCHILESKHKMTF